MHRIRRIRQLPGHCGPATVEMLYSFYGIAISQESVANAIGDVQRIIERGCSIDEMAAAIDVLTPDYTLLGKMFATVDDLITLTEAHRLPVGVEWRGRFLEPDGYLWEEGHYSIITRVDCDEGSLDIIDPYAPGVNLLSMNESIPIEVFVQRWWDTNPFPLPENPLEMTEVRDDQLLFVLLPKARADALRALQLYPMLTAYAR